VKTNTHHKINYVEFPCRNLPETKAFFRQAFGFAFSDFGPDYMCFQDEGIDGGFYKADVASTQETGGALVVFYSEKLEESEALINIAGGAIVKPIFDFPGGRRFHFKEPSGNEFAVWSDVGGE